MASAFMPILLYSLIMAFSSFVSSLIPLLINFSSSKLNYVSKFSVGLIISSSMVLIIPEGLEHYTVDQPVGLWMLFGFILLFTVDSLTTIYSDPHSHASSISSSSMSQKLVVEESIQLGDIVGPSSEHEHDSINTHSPLSPPPSSSTPAIITAAGTTARSRLSMIKSVFQNPTTLGLIIHSFTDGIALSSSLISSSTSSHSISIKSSLIVFAIFIHKLPTSFALTSILLSSKQLTKSEILYHISAFALSLPFGSLLTYFILTLIFSVDLNEFSGQLLIFSGGSFLYVGFHSLHSMYNETSSNNSMNVKERRREQLKGYLMCLIGMLVPTLITLIDEEDQ